MLDDTAHVEALNRWPDRIWVMYSYMDVLPPNTNCYSRCVECKYKEPSVYLSAISYVYYLSSHSISYHYKCYACNIEI